MRFRSKGGFTLWVLSFLLLFVSCKDEIEKKGSVVFIGDSLVEGWDLKLYFPAYEATNKGVSGAKVAEILDWDIDAKDKIAVYLIGTNNVGSVSAFQSTDNAILTNSYLEVIHTVNAPQNIVISLLPRHAYEERPTINEEIKQLNKELKEAFASYGHIEFLDVYDYFTEPGGDSVNEYYFKDGLHLNREGYDLLSELITPLLEQMTLKQKI